MLRELVSKAIIVFTCLLMTKLSFKETAEVEELTLAAAVWVLVILFLCSHGWIIVERGGNLLEFFRAYFDGLNNCSWLGSVREFLFLFCSFFGILPQHTWLTTDNERPAARSVTDCLTDELTDRSTDSLTERSDELTERRPTNSCLCHTFINWWIFLWIDWVNLNVQYLIGLQMAAVPTFRPKRNKTHRRQQEVLWFSIKTKGIFNISSDLPSCSLHFGTALIPH